MTGLLIWVASGDSITGCGGCWPYQVLGVTSIGDCGQKETQKPCTYYAPGIIACDMGISGLRLNTNPGDLDQIAPAWIDPVAAVKSYPGGKARRYLYTCSIGSNDGALGGLATPAEYAAAVAVHCVARKTAGFDKAVMTTLLPRGTGMTEGNRLAYNALLVDAAWRAAHGIDGVIDFAADSIMGDPANLSNATWYEQVTRVHPTDAGQARLAPIAQPVINGYIP
jgi:hypothetical protein